MSYSFVYVVALMDFPQYREEKMTTEFLGTKSALLTHLDFAGPFYSGGLFTVSLDGLSESGTTRSLNCKAHFRVANDVLSFY